MATKASTTSTKKTTTKESVKATKTAATPSTATKAAPKSSSDVKEFSTAEKIAALYELQLIDSRLDEINHIKGTLPAEVQDMENLVVGAEALIAKHIAQSEEALQAVKTKKEEIEASKILITKYEEQQNEVRNNREFESLGKEVEFQNLEIELYEKRIKEFNAEAKAKKVLAEDAGDILKDRQKELDIKRVELEVIEAESSEKLVIINAEAELIKLKIDERLLKAYTRIRSNTRNGLAVVTVERDACGGCFNRIPPQRRIDIEASKKVIVCEYCGRVIVSSNLAEEE